MNNVPYPYMPFPNFNNMPPLPPNYDEELKRLNYEIEKLKTRLTKLEKKETKDYLQKEEGMYMM